MTFQIMKRKAGPACLGWGQLVMRLRVPIQGGSCRLFLQSGNMHFHVELSTLLSLSLCHNAPPTVFPRAALGDLAKEAVYKLLLV